MYDCTDLTAMLTAMAVSYYLFFFGKLVEINNTSSPYNNNNIRYEGESIRSCYQGDE